MARPCPPSVKVRPFLTSDAQATRAIYHDAVIGGTSAHYSRSQRLAWAGSRAVPPGWVKRLREQYTLVATLEGRIIGFMSMAKSGYLDLAFVLPAMMGSGIAARIYEALEAWARKSGLTALTTEASHLARSFFSKHGWKVVAAQEVEIRGQLLENFRMAKSL